jgi:hypothetical protein
MSVKKITKQEKILCNACYEAGQSSAVSEIRELEKKLAIAEGEWKTYAKMADDLSKKLADALRLANNG